jgi:hypothetical protein
MNPVTCAAATCNTAVMAMPAAPTIANGIVMFRSGTTPPPSVTLAVVSPRVLSATNNFGPAFAHFPKSVSYVAPLEDAAVIAIVAIIAVVAVVAIVIVVVMAVADAVIESPVVVVLVVLLRATPSSMPSLGAPPSLSLCRAPLVLVGCYITSSLIAPPSLSTRLIVESPPLLLHRHLSRCTAATPLSLRHPSLVVPHRLVVASPPLSLIGWRRVDDGGQNMASNKTNEVDHQQHA